MQHVSLTHYHLVILGIISLFIVVLLTINITMIVVTRSSVLSEQPELQIDTLSLLVPEASERSQVTSRPSLLLDFGQFQKLGSEEYHTEGPFDAGISQFTWTQGVDQSRIKLIGDTSRLRYVIDCGGAHERCVLSLKNTGALETRDVTLQLKGGQINIDMPDTDSTLAFTHDPVPILINH